MTPPRVLFAISFTSLVPQWRAQSAATSLREQRGCIGTSVARSRSAALTCKHESMVGSVPHHLAATSLAPKRKPEVCFPTHCRPSPLLTSKLTLSQACQLVDNDDDEEFKPGSKRIWVSLL
ncbi:hypothetical protein CVT26_010167 [Gymnopilus dilepis]|uniref:Uncharacterized protein n=1 Tax=Gymnopilus dilepis TaxID=231916 RepID=A0A409YS89_9AGAR|nr:hypothetical protein CVT26_010167 [Gymnopilus dilepis]